MNHVRLFDIPPAAPDFAINAGSVVDSLLDQLPPADAVELLRHQWLKRMGADSVPTPRTFTYGSACSGIEAATVAWRPLGWEAAWFAEIAEFPSALLAHRYQEVPNLGDITAIDAAPGSIDLLAGGTPCQSFSITGLRRGLDDDRGNLARGFLRLTIRTRPRWLLWENVPGVLSVDGGRAFGSLVGGLEELGYGWAYRTLDAVHFGVPQRRRRLFLVGHFGGDWRPAAAVLFDRPGVCPHPGPAGEVPEVPPAGCRAGLPGPDRGRPPIFGWTGDETPKCLVNVAPTMRAQQGGEGYGFATAPDVIRRFTPAECERLLGFETDYTLIPFRGRLAAECADRPRSIALGNSMAVPVMRWIGRRIQHVDAVVNPAPGSVIAAIPVSQVRAVAH
jgi:DNA (cytosine-5)-methyltransferase 1